MSSIEKFVGSREEFNGMVKTMKQAELPVCLQHQDPIEAGITLEDMRQFAIEFRNASGLNLEYQMSVCDNCDRLHLFMIIDEKFDEDE